MEQKNSFNIKSLKRWLDLICLWILLIIIVGGLTRLTQSGLSIVEWEPITGVIPPLNESEWQETFAKYKAFPEYQKLNQSMTLSEFKFIFFWEYLHRILARSLGVIFFIPWLYFVLRKRINLKLSLKLCFGVLLGALQALLGWYMVKSGLVDRPSVSHFRLAAHFSLALITLCYYLWIRFSLSPSLNSEKNKSTFFVERKHKIFSSFFFALLTIQLIYGAFLAGLDGGIYFNTFPKMANTWFPKDNLILEPYLSNFINSVAGIQFIHRYLGKLIFVLSIFLFVIFRKKSKYLATTTFLIFIACLWQFILGIATLLSTAPLYLASLHQFSAVILLCFSLALIYQLKNLRSLPNPR